MKIKLIYQGKEMMGWNKNSSSGSSNSFRLGPTSFFFFVFFLLFILLIFKFHTHTQTHCCWIITPVCGMCHRRQVSIAQAHHNSSRLKEEEEGHIVRDPRLNYFYVVITRSAHVYIQPKEEPKIHHNIRNLLFKIISYHIMKLILKKIRIPNNEPSGYRLWK